MSAVRSRLRDLTDAAKEAKRFENLKLLYGITREEYYALIEVQNWKCGICKTALDEGLVHGIHVDHCHQTDVIRGILCGPCNQLLGKIEGKFHAVLDYLDNHHDIAIPRSTERMKPGRKPLVMTAEEREAKTTADREKRKLRMRERRAKVAA